MPFLTKERQLEIEDIINTIFTDIGLQYPEDNLLEIVRFFGIDVFLVDFDDPLIRGVIDYGDIPEEGKISIYINKKLSKESRTFTLAHEFGHYILHSGKEKIRIDKFDYTFDSEESLEEVEANYFAASLLIPKEEFKTLYYLTEGNLYEIAKYFGVSLSSIKTRKAWIERNS